MPRMRYSERKRLAETGTLGNLIHDDVPDAMRTAVNVVVEGANPQVRDAFYDGFNRELIQHFGVGQRWISYISKLGTDDFLDLIEILVEDGRREYLNNAGRHRMPIPDVEERLNRIFERFLFGYRVEDGSVRHVGSPALEVEVVGPALLALQREGWEEAERSYRKALAHLRSGEIGDALTAANAATEAALKACGMKGKTLKELSRSFKNAGIVPGYLANVPELIEDMLDRLHAARSNAGDAHGKAPDAPDVPPELANLAIYWAGAFIVYLADASATSTGS